jgi:hypothetical protein
VPEISVQLYTVLNALQRPAGQGEIDPTPIPAAAPHALRVIEFDSFGGDVFKGIADSLAWLQQNDPAGVTA